MKYGRYKILNSLGKGSMGEVYLAHDPHIDRKVALKVLHKNHLASKEIIQRFVKEAKAIGRLSHPDIVGVYDVGQDKGTIYIAMEYLKGKPLNQAIKSNRLDIPTIVKIGRQVAAALDYAHQNGIVHRDIKPSNLMMTDNFRVKITDFGIAHFDDASQTLKTRSGDILGTPAYMSPEQISGGEVDSRSDVYSLGVILYELLVGRRPFVEKNITALFRAISEHKLVPPRKANPAIPAALSAVILKAIGKQPEARHQSGAELASALGAFLPESVSDTQPAGRRIKARGIAWAAAAVAMAVLGWQLFANAPPEPTVMAIVKISSEPINASIYINNQYKGKTPKDCELPLGEYEVRLTLASHYESEAKIDVGEPGEMPVHLRLIPKE